MVFELLIGDWLTVRIYSHLRANRYEAGGGEGQWAGLAPHRDGFLLSFSLLLSRPGVDFNGGGTRLATIGAVSAGMEGNISLESLIS